MLCSNIGINESGHLTFAGEDTVRLAAHYKTPLYLMDEDRIRENCRVYKAAMARAFGEGSFPLYASKAASFKRIYAIMQDEGMAIDVVSAGEIATAKRAGFQMERAFFHGNNKTPRELQDKLARMGLEVDEQHRRLVEAIISGDRNQAEKLMREHMETIEKYILEIAQQQGENSLVFHR